MSFSVSDWRAALKCIPWNVKRKHHGRDLKEGVDCVGFIIAAYRLIGVDLRDIDVPYTELDYRQIKPGDTTALIHRRNIAKMMKGRLALKFRCISACYIHELRTGDVLIMGSDGTECHLALYAEGIVYCMADRLRAVDATKAWKMISSVWRLP